MLNEDHDAPTIKSVIIGDSSVGKTCILHRYKSNRFEDNSMPTLGVEMITRVVQIDGKFYTLQIWDTAGQERYRSIVSTYYKNASIVYFVFSLQNRQTFLDIPNWYNEVIATLGDEVITVLIGNKSDMEYPEVTNKEASEFAQKHNMRYFETSAKNGVNIEPAIEEAVRDVKIKSNYWYNQVEHIEMNETSCC